MRLLITGGSGFVGRHLLDRISAGFGPCELSEVVICSRTLTDVGHAVKQVSWDVCDPKLPDLQFDAVVHAATPASAELNARSPRIMFDQIVLGARNVIDLCAIQKEPPRLVFTSSGAVYGEMPEDLAAWPEDSSLAADTLDPKNAYANGKRAAEAMFSLAGREGLCLPTIARLFAFSGRHLPLNLHFALGNFVRDAVAGVPIHIRGSGRPVRSYLDGADMADWLLVALGSPLSVGRILHVGSDQPIEVGDLARVVSRLAQQVLGRGVPVETAGRSTYLDGRDRYVPSTTRTRELLGVRQQIDLEASVAAMLTAASARRILGS